MGRRGDVVIKAGPDTVYDSYEDWKAGIDLDAARKAPRNGDKINPRYIVEIVPTDEAAIGVADPKYALWLRLNDKFGAD